MDLSTRGVKESEHIFEEWITRVENDHIRGHLIVEVFIQGMNSFQQFRIGIVSGPNVARRAADEKDDGAARRLETEAEISRLARSTTIHLRFEFDCRNPTSNRFPVDRDPTPIDSAVRSHVEYSR